VTAALPYGDRAWLVDEVDDPVALAARLRLVLPVGAELVVGARTCLIRYPGPAPNRAQVDDLIAAAEPTEAEAQSAEPVVTIRVRYDGEDLHAVAEHTGLSVAEVVSVHSQATYRVAFLGFAPGFGYLTGLPEVLRLPRRSVPRVRVPAGAVAIADAYSAIYPRSSPGGWHLLGTSAEWLFDTQRDPPARLRPGTLVRFEAK
jgi:KipI family sensor histidine kinase inhibitor